MKESGDPASAAPPMRVRPASEHELVAVLAMYEWLFEPPGARPPAWDPAVALTRLRRLHADPRGTVLVGETGGDIAGFCTIVLDIESVRFGQRAWVEDLAVHPSHRSIGVGKAILDAAKEWARQRGASHLELDSGETRRDAHRFYEREHPTWRSACFGWWFPERMNR